MIDSGRETQTRRCGECDACCTVLRVDELAKLGGQPCPHLATKTSGCGIHATRPAICRGYRCLWLDGALDDDDRPDRLGAILDVVTPAETSRLRIHELSPGAYERSARLREIAGRYREVMPVHVSGGEDMLDPERPHRVLLPDGEEQRITGDRMETFRDGRLIASRRLPWLDRALRRVVIALRGRRLRRRARRGTRLSRRLDREHEVDRSRPRSR